MNQNTTLTQDVHHMGMTIAEGDVPPFTDVQHMGMTWTQVPAAGDVAPLSTEAGERIGMTEFRADARFADTFGSGYSVVVIDTGIDLNHRAFGPDNNNDGVSDRIVYHEDFSFDDDGTADDVNGHGSNVASIIGSSAPGYEGIAPEVNIIALQALSNGGGGLSSDIEDAVQWVIANAEAYNIVAVNMSLGDSVNLNEIQAHRLMGDEFATLAEMNVATVVAAGNSYFQYQEEGASSYAVDPNTIAVGAVWDGDYGRIRFGSGAEDFSTGADRLTSFTQRSDDIDMVFAPGAFSRGAAPGGGTAQQAGTSQAAPVVSGMIALAQELADENLGRRLTMDELRMLLVDSADQIYDGDDEDNNVTNSENFYSRVNMNTMAEMILAMADDPVVPVPDDYGETPQTAGSVDVGGSVTGAIETADDEDWFAVTLEAGQSYTFAVNNGASLTIIGTDVVETGDAGAQVNFTAPESGTYYLMVEGPVGDYEVSVEEIPLAVADDYGTAPSDAGRLAMGDTATGTIEEGGDQDWFAVDVVAGGVYQFEMRGSPTGDGDLRDTLMAVRDADGTLLARNDDGGTGLNSLLQFTATETGTIYIDAGSYGNNTGTYTLEAAVISEPAPVTGDDYGTTPGTAGRIAVDGVATGVIEEARDTDWFAVDVEEGAVYMFEQRGSRTDDGTLSDPLMEVYAANGTRLARNDDGGEGYNSRLEFTAAETGTIYIAAGGYGSREGSYTVEATLVTPAPTPDPAPVNGDDYGTDFETAGRIEVGASVTGNIEEARDADWFAFDVAAGGTYEIDMPGSVTGGGDLSDTFIWVRDSQGNRIGFDDDGGAGYESNYAFTAEETGTYYIEATGFGSNTGTYTLDLTGPTPSAMTDQQDALMMNFGIDEWMVG